MVWDHCGCFSWLISSQQCTMECFMHLPPHLPWPTTSPPPTHSPPCYIHPEISAHLKNQLNRHENQPSWIFKVRCIKANDLVHTKDKAWYKQQLVMMDGMFKNDISWNIGKCELGWFLFKQSQMAIFFVLHKEVGKEEIWTKLITKMFVLMR